jgi:hypothetical protein
MDSYIGNRPLNQAAGYRSEFIATAGQTVFNVTYAVGYVDVFLNGVKLAAADFTATDGATVTLAVGATAGDVVAFIAWAKGAMVPVDALRKRETVTKAASGAVVTFDVPTWATSITILWREVALSGLFNTVIQLGVGGALVTTGYAGAHSRFGASSMATEIMPASGFLPYSNAASKMSGHMKISRQNTDGWVYSSVLAREDAVTYISSGRAAISGAVDKIGFVVSSPGTYTGGEMTLVFEA